MRRNEKQKIEIEKLHWDPLPPLNQAVTAGYSDFLGTALVLFRFFRLLVFLHRRPRLVRNLAVGFSPTHTSLRSVLRTMITCSNSLFRERDAPSCGRRFTSRHVRYRAVPRTNRTSRPANTRSQFATSNTT